MLDQKFITRKVKLIQEDLSRLDKLGHYSFDEVAQDFVKQGAVERYLEKVIMRAIDINQHLIAELGKGDEPVKGYEETYRVLADLKVYPKQFAQKIAPSAGLRNRLVHEYNDTKPEIIYQSVGEAISQYARYCDYVLQFISQKSP